MDTLFFWVSKLVWLLISPDSLLLLLVVGGWLCLAFKWQKLGRRLVSLAALVLLLIGFLPLGEWLVSPLENRFPTNPALPDRVDGIIVLGGTTDPLLSSLWEQPELGDAAERLTGFLDLANRFPTARLLYTGGSGSLLNQEYKEADTVDQLLYQLGYVNHRVEFERESRNTFENAVNSKALVNPQPGENWILITSAFHMPRSVGIFCAQDWPVIPYPVDHISRRGQRWRVELDVLEHLSSLNTALHEWIGLLAYRATGKTRHFLPARDGCNPTITTVQ